MFFLERLLHLQGPPFCSVQVFKPFCEFLVYVFIYLLYDIYVQGNREHKIKPVNFKDTFAAVTAYVLGSYYMKMSS